MVRRSSKSTVPGGVSIVLALAFVIGSGLAFAAPQEPAARPASAANHGIIWAPNTAHGSDSLTTVFKYTNFSDVSALTFNGNARQQESLLLVTPAGSWEDGSVWYNNQVNVGQGFMTEFTLEMVPSKNSPTTADGMAFVIQNSELNALGAYGGEMGYTGIANSLAVEFDPYLNTEYSDPNNNHIAIQSCGVGENTSNHATCNHGLQPNLPVTLADGARHVVSITYYPGPSETPGMMTVAIDKQVVLTSMMNLSAVLSLNGNDAWIGFTGATGASWEYGTVRNWAFASVGE